MLPEIKVKIDADTTGLTKGLAAATEKLTKFGKVAGAAVGVAVVGAATGLAALTKAAIDNADELDNMSQRTGVSVEALSRLQYAAKLSDTSIESLQTGFRTLANNMVAGSGAFAKLGISITNTDGSMRSSVEIFSEIADRFAGMENGALKSSLAVDIFGRSGLDLIPMLNAGSAGLAEFARQSDQAGYTLSTEAASGAAKFKNTLDGIGITMNGVVNKVMVAALPALQSLADTLASPEFAEAAVTFAKGIIDAFNAVIEAVTFVTNSLKDFLDFLAGTGDHAGPLLNKLLQGEKLNLADRLRALSTQPRTDGDAYAGFALNEDGSLKVEEPPPPYVPDAELERIAARLAVIQQGFLSENELLTQKYKEDQQLLNDALAKKLMTEEEYQAAIQSLEQQHTDKLSAIAPAVPDAELERIAARLAVIQQGFLSENELLTQKYEDDQQLLNDALAKKLMTEQEHQATIQQLEQDHVNTLSSIRDAAQNRDLQSMGSFFGAVGSIMEQGGGQMLGIAKAFGAAQALINSYVAASQALADPTVPFWGKAAAFASMVATGLQAVSSIKGATPGGGGGAPTAASSGGVASSAMNRTLTVQGITPGQIFSGDAMRDFMERMLDMQRDGYQVVLA